MSVEVLREAAALMRERAKAASPGPWTWGEYGGRNGSDPVPYMMGRGGDPATYAYDTEVIEPGHSACDLELRVRIEDREHIASWHPAVALAVADWLDRVVALYPTNAYDDRFPGSETARALAVARAYLGGDQ